MTFVQGKKGVESLFDTDDDVVMARPRMRASSTSSGDCGGRTIPMSSETDGYGAPCEKMDQDEDESDMPGPRIDLKAKGKVCFHTVSSLIMNV